MRHPTIKAGNANTDGTRLEQPLPEQFDRVTQLLVDLDSGVSARQPPELQGPGFVTWWRFFTRHRPAQNPALPARTADEQFAPVLGVQVQHAAAGNQPRVQVRRPVESGLLLHGEQQLQRWMRYRLIRHQRQGGGTANAVVGAQGGPVRQQPPLLHLQLEGVP